MDGAEAIVAHAIIARTGRTLNGRPGAGPTDCAPDTPRTVTGMGTFRSKFKREFWRPEDPKVLVRKQPMFGWGWTINFAAIAKRLRRRG